MYNKKTIAGLFGALSSTDVVERLCEMVRSLHRSDLAVKLASSRASTSADRAAFRVMVSETLKQHDFILPVSVYRELLERSLAFPEYDRAYFAELFSMIKKNGLVQDEGPDSSCAM